MPKKQKQSPRKYQYWKQTAAAFAIVALAAAGLWQYQFNRDTEHQLMANSVFQTRSLIVDSIEGLADIMSSPGANNKIPETHLQLPATTDMVDRVLYGHQEARDGFAEELHVTSRLLVQLGTAHANGATIDELFGNVPEAQSCVRGFVVRFNDNASNLPGEDMRLAGTKKLADGRTMHLWRDPLCGKDADPNTNSGLRKDAMDALEKYLLQAQSY